MRLKLLMCTLVLIIGAALLNALPPTRAQEDPGATPGPIFGPLVVGLPFSDTFDTTAANWRGSGAWTIDSASAFEGFGWTVNTAQRETESTLEYNSMIDLGGTQGAQLRFRQKGSMPASDLAAVDLSLDGGNSWFMIDMQVGVQTDWALHVVDLAEYRGQVVRLRFRVFTGVQPAPTDPAPGTYHIDNVSIQYVMVPTVPDAPNFDAPGTLMGVHLIMHSPQYPLLDVVRRLRDAGLPMGTVKGTTGTEDLINQIAQISPDTVIVFRSLLVDGYGMYDCPLKENNPIEEARRWMDGVERHWQAVPADFYELMNECPLPVDWMNTFTVEAMRIANTRQRCMLVLNFGAGAPEIDDYTRYLPVYQYALQHECQPGRRHGIALHAYAADKQTLVSESGPYLGLRHRLYYERLAAVLPDAAQLPVYLTEVAPGDGSAPFTCEQITRDVIQYTEQLENDPYIKGFHLWTLGAGIPGQWLDVSPCLPMITDALLQYYG
ncbi:MAG: hypothetical protein JXQ72_06110 [Anaerolineae bacterium]|nr:hypothetical protein [Anaerolineae bacterium]